MTNALVLKSEWDSSQFKIRYYKSFKDLEDIIKRHLSTFKFEKIDNLNISDVIDIACDAFTIKKQIKIEIVLKDMEINNEN